MCQTLFSILGIQQWTNKVLALMGLSHNLKYQQSTSDSYQYSGERQDSGVECRRGRELFLDRASLVEVTVKQTSTKEPATVMSGGRAFQADEQGQWPGQVWTEARVTGKSGRRRVQRPDHGALCAGCFPFVPPHPLATLLCCLGSCLWPNQQASLTSGFLWDLANGRHLQELRGQTSLLRAPLLSEHLQQLRVALCTSGWRWGVGGRCLIPLQGCQLQGLACSGSGGSPKPLTPLEEFLWYTLQIQIYSTLLSALPH